MTNVRNPSDPHDFSTQQPTGPVDNFVLKFQKPRVNIDRSGGRSACVDSQRRFAVKTRRSPAAYPSIAPCGPDTDD